MEGNATEFAATMLAFTVALVPLTGIMTIVTPFLMRRGEVFAVTVPDTAAHDPYLRRLKRRYALLMATLTAVLTALFPGQDLDGGGDLHATLESKGGDPP